MNFDRKIESKIITISILSLLGPPMGWILIILASELLVFTDLWKILTNPFFYMYIFFFLGLNYYLTRRALTSIKILAEEKQFDSINRMINKTPFWFFLFTGVYGFLGPPAVILGLGFSEYVFYMCWVLGPVVISTFSIPFFNYYLSQFYKYTREIPLDKSSIFSLSKRLNISIIYLVLGVLMMITIVFYNIFYQHIHNNPISLPELRVKLLVFLFLSSLIIGIPLFLVNAEFKRNLLRVSNYLQVFREGKLGISLETSQRDELGFLIDDAKNLSKHFKEIISHLKESVLTLSKLGYEITHTSEFIASGGDIQKKNGEKLAEDLRLLLNETTKNASVADELSHEANQMRSEIQEGQMELRSLYDSISTISKNLKSINEISQQTNMLALNATVEASNAGEHGKGFSVIAGEVRKLADRSNQVAGEINRLIKEILLLAEGSTTKFEHFARVVQNNASMCQSIKHSSIQQKEVIDSITRKMDEFNEKINLLASHADKMESNAGLLKNLSSDLKSASDYFTIADS